MSEKHNIKPVRIRLMDRSVEIENRCSCQKSPGDECPEIAAQLMKEGTPKGLARLLSIRSANQEIV